MFKDDRRLISMEKPNLVRNLCQMERNQGPRLLTDINSLRPSDAYMRR